MEESRSRPAADRAARLEAGTMFDGFRLVEPVGDGGMGVIWLAEEVALGRKVVLKFLRQDRLANPDALARFRREALAAARLHHPGIVTVYAVGNARGQPYIAQEYVEGGRTLAHWIEEARARGEHGHAYFHRVAALVTEACAALHAAHESDVVHRDVKPQNLLLTPEGRLKVADFGLARIAGGEAITDSGVALGTLMYASPEQVSGGREPDRRADLFGLGATFYEMLTFQRAFDADSVDAILDRILHHDPPPPESVARHVPHDLALLCCKALQKRPEDRFATMQVLEDELGRYLRDEPLRTRPPSSVQRARKWLRRHPAASTSAAVLLLATCAVAWAMARSSDAMSRSRREELLTSAGLAIEQQDLERAEQLIAEANELGPDDYRGDLLLASGYARFGRVPEARRALAAARERGFVPDPAGLSTALEHGAYALYLWAEMDVARYPEAEEHVARALALDDSLTALHFALFQLRRECGDLEGARAALAELRGNLRTADPFVLVVQALEQELGGDLAGAMATLEALRARGDVDAERLRELRWHRNMGRLCLSAGDLERGEGFLEEAVRETPDDGGSHSALAALFKLRFQEDVRDVGWLARAEESAARALQCNPGLEEARIALAFVHVTRFGLEPRETQPARSSAHAAARAALDMIDADAPQRRELESYLLVLEARSPLARLDYASAAGLLRRALEHDGSELRAAALLGQCCWRLRRFDEGLPVLQRALEVWDDPRWPGPREEQWLGVILAWTLGNAEGREDAEALGAARDRLVEELDRGARFGPEELLSAAEFLSSEAPQELRDCELALALIEDHDLRTAFEDRPDREHALAILERIAAACR